MRLLLDTHVLLWWLSSPEKLNNEVFDAIADSKNQVFVSAATAWEIAIKSKIEKLAVSQDVRPQLNKNNFNELNITFPHVLRAGSLPLHHHDPFDGLLIAQADLENLVLVTQDSKLEPYDVPLLKN